MSNEPTIQLQGRCLHCGSELVGTTCPRCALALAGAEVGFDDEEICLLFPELDIVGKIARGGFGTVYRAEHRRLKRPVALKFLDPKIAESAAGVERFEEEMAAVGKLDHPGIVRAHDAGEREGHWFIVMEFVDGEDLGTLSRRAGRMGTREACYLVRQAALALAYAHGNGLVHRDVKPSNIMVATGADGGKMVALAPVKVLDFGLAATVDKVGEGFQGTPDYAAPEQINTPGDLDARADIYGLGATLFRLLTGVPPRRVGGEVSISSRIQRIGGTAAPPIASLRDDLPAGLAELCDRMLAMDRDERPGTAQEVADLLAPFAGLPKPRRRWLWPAAALLLLGVLCGWFFSRPKPVEPLPDQQSAVVKRKFKDIGEGLFFFNGTPISIQGTATAWSFYDEDGGTGVVTPLLLTRIGEQQFVIQGVGTSRRSGGTGAQTFPFGLLAGSDTVGPNTCFGFTDRLVQKGTELGTLEYVSANPGVVDGENGGPWLFVHGARLTATPPMRVGLEFAVIEGDWKLTSKPVPVNVGRTYSARAIVEAAPAAAPLAPTAPLVTPNAGTLDDDIPPLSTRQPAVRTAAPLAAGITVIDDDFDDGVLGTNATGKGDGFRDMGRARPTESDGFLNLDRALLDNEMTYVCDLANVIYPFEAAATSATWTFGTIQRSPGRQRLWVGWRTAHTVDDRFFGGSIRADAVNIPARGLYVSILSQNRKRDGYATRGNLVATDEIGKITVLASWRWLDPDKLSGLSVKLTTTTDRYRLDFSGAEGGIPIFATGGPEGALTGLGQPGDTVYDFGGMNQFPDGQPATTKLDRIVIEKKVPWPSR